MRAHPIGVAFGNDTLKYVLHRPRSPTRNGRTPTVLSGDLAAAMKPRPGGELRVHGSGA